MRRSTSAGLSDWFASLESDRASHLLGQALLTSTLALSPLLSATEAPSSLDVPPELISPQDLCQGSGIVCTTGPIGARITALAAEQIAGERLWFNANKSHATSGIAKYTWSLTKPNGSFAELNSTRNRAIYFDADMSAPFTLTLTVTDKQGNVAEDTLTFTPDLPTPIPLPTFTPTAPPTPALADEADAIRFLYQATMGPRVEDVDYLMSIGAEAWFEEQTSMQQRGYVEAWATIAEDYDDAGDGTDEANGVELNHEAFMFNALNSPDQLRQRMTFALSQLLVVSADFDFSHHDQLVLGYVDVLHDRAFGNYRDLLKAATLHPAMGLYLAMLGNQKADPERNIRPDENFAREVMQLFTVGLRDLNQNGTPRLDDQGEIIQTYWPADIQNYAAALTGWYFAGLESYRFGNSFTSVEWSQRLAPMAAYDDYHQKTHKKLLRNYYIPAGASAEESLETVLDSLFFHPNLAPFVSLHLIKAFVTSNPSPAYVGRVSAVFNQNDNGERGNLKSVLQAVLFDAEARMPVSEQPSSYGRAKEPLLKFVNYQRFFKATSYLGINNNLIHFRPSQEFLRSPSVFNFFSPTHTPNLAFASQGLVAPELEIITADALVQDSSSFGYPRSKTSMEFDQADTPQAERKGWVYYDFSPMARLISEDDGCEAAINFANHYLAQGRLSPEHQLALKDRFQSEVDWIMLSAWGSPEEKQKNIDNLVARMVYAIVTTPEYSVQR